MAAVLGVIVPAAAGVQAAVDRTGPERHIITHGSRHRPEVALTFDADMTDQMLARVHAGGVPRQVDRRLFALLRRTHTPATVFLTGLWTRAYPREARRLARNPLFQLENHSYDHRAWTSPCFGLPTVSGPAAKRVEVMRTQRIVRRITGVTPRFFRFPGGCGSSADRRLVGRLGLDTVGWDVVSGDAFQPDAAVIVRTVLSRVRPGSIVVAHCIGAPNTPATARAMARIIPALRARGYKFVTLDRLLRVGR